MKFILVFLVSILTCGYVMTQDTLPYYDIPEAPEKMTAGAAISRSLDGLGYRYYWATEGLKDEDLVYRISEDSRTAGETLIHLYGLSEFIFKVISNENIVRGAERPELEFAEMRKKTLENIYQASMMVREKTDDEIEKCEIVFQRGEKTTAMPVWNLLNGPLSDALYHTGQIVTYRRASGNPMYPGVNVFSGKTRK